MLTWQILQIYNSISEEDPGFSSTDFRHQAKAPEIIFQEGIHDLKKEVVKVHSKIILWE